MNRENECNHHHITADEKDYDGQHQPGNTIEVLLDEK
jgi:hypothetical protein